MVREATSIMLVGTFVFVLFHTVCYEKSPYPVVKSQDSSKNKFYHEWSHQKVSRIHIFNRIKIQTLSVLKMVNFDQLADFQPSPKAFGARTSVFWQENRISGSKLLIQ